ncbi:FadR/GntR family transcriptional regulator [Antarcticirhabdus aurantiaca]|uniref:FadR/GntR family transcriptional regulator n=1 Tax=Antarcticirhabdus aurantiaca TaxID=2606717 RepID=A0ACD4NMM1_9HYPH|nr:FadR/GntR family transcriptional regulator [Antarcticirhabdus aurantiaca]WAJ27977.1 FadR/GntR family transcriptional regulator [Jeongeuplla avenae]
MSGSVTGLPRLPPANRTRDAINVIAEYISRTGLKPNERLPTEHEVMAALGIGRSTVREVMRHFQALGVVETRRGSGSFLLKPVSAATVHVPLSFDPGPVRDGLLQTLDVRRGLEVEASMLAAVRADADDIAKMRATLEEMERVHLEKGTAGREDLAFHLSIYDATHNPLFGQIMEQMRGAFESFFEKPFDRPDFARRSFPFHRELFDAIAGRDAPLAREKTLQILAIVEEDIKDMSK